MKLSWLTLFVILLSFICNNSSGQQMTFKIIKESHRTTDFGIDTNEIKKLDEPLKAMAALYSAMAGTACDTSRCELTTSLGLGDQGSEIHIALIKKYFPNDKVAKTVISQYCRLGINGSSNFSDYEYLTMTKSMDTIKVYYKVSFYNHGKSSMINDHDIYLFRDNEFIKLRRKFWSWADK